MTNTALIIVDVQNDFISGSLAVDGGESVALGIAKYLSAPEELLYDYIVTTQDWHIDPGNHFSSEPNYVDTWPAHCKAATRGAWLHDGLVGLEFDEQFFKGHYSAAYSGFEGVTYEDGETLEAWLRKKHVTTVDICGIATDYCVKATALDAVKAGFHASLLLDLIAEVDPLTGQAAIAEMATAGVILD